MKRLKGFTLAEVLITLAIIGVVAAISIPSVISNSQQQEFKTGLRKAVSVLNSAITMNMAIDGESPYDNKDLFNFLQRHMSVMKTTQMLPWRGFFQNPNGTFGSYRNGAFYTTDGMRFEFNDTNIAQTQDSKLLKLHDSNLSACFASVNSEVFDIDENQTVTVCGGCGSYGMKHNPNSTNKVPCAIIVDVNGDRKPTPQFACATEEECGSNSFKYFSPDIKTKKIHDIFTILITEDRAIPYGVVAQKAMYQAQK